MNRSFTYLLICDHNQLLKWQLHMMVGCFCHCWRQDSKIYVHAKGKFDIATKWKHRKYCESCHSQVTWKVKFKSQFFCPVCTWLFCLSYEKVVGYLTRCAHRSLWGINHDLLGSFRLCTRFLEVMQVFLEVVQRSDWLCWRLS